MSRGFDRLRIGALAVGAASTALAAGVARKASAAPVSLPVDVTEGGIRWTNVDNFKFAASFNGFGISDATHTATPTINDPFDNALVLAIDGAAYNDPDGIVDLKTNAGTRIKSVGTMEDIKVTVKYLFFSKKPMVRALYTLKNNGESATDVEVNVDTDFGDSSPVIAETKDGDTTIDAASDSWFVVERSGASPAMTWSRGKGWGPLQNTPVSDGDHYTEERTVSLQPGESKRILMFAFLGTTTEKAVNKGPKFTNGSTIPSSFLTGLGSKARSKVINYNLL